MASFFVGIYTELIYRPLLNALVAIYAFLPYHDLGLAIVVLTVLVRLLMHPTVAASIRSQRAMSRLQPQLREIQEQYKNDREEQGRRVMAAYRAAGIHPLSGCIPIIIQIPIFIGLYHLFARGIALDDQSLLYAFARSADAFSPVAFGVFNLSQPSAILAIVAGATQFFQSKFIPPPLPSGSGGGAAGDFSRALVWQTTFILPLVIVFISWSAPAAVAFYWTVLNVVVIVQQLWIQRRLRA